MFGGFCTEYVCVLMKEVKNYSSAFQLDTRSVRIEPKFSSKAELRAVIRTLKENQVKHFNITNKSKTESVQEHLHVCIDELGIEPSVSLCMHYALEHNRPKIQRGKRESAQSETFERFFSTLTQITQTPNTEMLLVSGTTSNSTRLLDSIACLERLSAKKAEYKVGPTDDVFKVGVAFNPYLTGDTQLIERDRLIRKLKSNCVRSIWLQFGSDLSLLEESIEWMNSLRNSVQIQVPDRIIGSLFIPTKSLLSSLRFRPWRGLCLSSEFLTNLETAQEIVQKMALIYSQAGIELLLEAPGFQNVQHLSYAQKILNDSHQIQLNLPT